MKTSFSLKTGSRLITEAAALATSTAVIAALGTISPERVSRLGPLELSCTEHNEMLALVPKQ